MNKRETSGKKITLYIAIDIEIAFWTKILLKYLEGGFLPTFWDLAPTLVQIEPFSIAQPSNPSQVRNQEKADSRPLRLRESESGLSFDSWKLVIKQAYYRYNYDWQTHKRKGNQ